MITTGVRPTHCLTVTQLILLDEYKSVSHLFVVSWSSHTSLSSLSPSSYTAVCGNHCHPKQTTYLDYLDSELQLLERLNIRRSFPRSAILLFPALIPSRLGDSPKPSDLAVTLLPPKLISKARHLPLRRSLVPSRA